VVLGPEHHLSQR